MVNGHSFILIRQMAALVRRALAEVCTVLVILVVLFSKKVLWQLKDLEVLRLKDTGYTLKCI